MAKAKHITLWLMVIMRQRKSCPTCKTKLEEGEHIWVWGEYSRNYWFSVSRFCKHCFEREVKAYMVSAVRGKEYDFRKRLGIVEAIPEWLKL